MLSSPIAFWPILGVLALTAALGAPAANAASVTITGPPDGASQYYLDDSPVTATADASGCAPGAVIVLIINERPGGLTLPIGSSYNTGVFSTDFGPTAIGAHRWWGRMTCPDPAGGGKVIVAESEHRTLNVTDKRTPTPAPPMCPAQSGGCPTKLPDPRKPVLDRLKALNKRYNQLLGAARAYEALGNMGFCQNLVFGASTAGSIGKTLMAQAAKLGLLGRGYTVYKTHYWSSRLKKIIRTDAEFIPSGSAADVRIPTLGTALDGALGYLSGEKCDEGLKGLAQDRRDQAARVQQLILDLAASTPRPPQRRAAAAAPAAAAPVVAPKKAPADVLADLKPDPLTAARFDKALGAIRAADAKENALYDALRAELAAALAASASGDAAGVKSHRGKAAAAARSLSKLLAKRVKLNAAVGAALKPRGQHIGTFKVVAPYRFVPFHELLKKGRLDASTKGDAKMFAALARSLAG